MSSTQTSLTASPVHPLLYEINTRCWLWQLRERHGTEITLANIPEEEVARWRELGFTHIWLMGVWRNGPQSRACSLRLEALRDDFARLLPDLSDEDFIGSPYAIAGYETCQEFGGNEGLNKFRQRLNGAGLKLILDFIPNHMGIDHPWITQRPELFVQGLPTAPGTFRVQTSSGARWIAHGKDPNFAPWGDTGQLDYRNGATRDAMIEQLTSLGRRCDGVRCDMAMLILNDVFTRTWEKFPTLPQTAEGKTASGKRHHLARVPPASEFWADAIIAVKKEQPDFLFLAEAYWGLERRLLELGFDFAYDKTLTDHLVARSPAQLQKHLFGLPRNTLQAGAHFLENHDEPRIASLLSPQEVRAAALLVAGLPGMRLLHQGQLTGLTLRTSVHLRRGPPEAPDSEITEFYNLLLRQLQKSAVGRGWWEILKPMPAWPGNPSAENLILLQWEARAGEFDLVAVNLAAHSSQCYVRLTITGVENKEWQMSNILGRERFVRAGAQSREPGLYLDLPAHAAQLFHFIGVD